VIKPPFPEELNHGSLPIYIVEVPGELSEEVPQGFE